MVESGSGSCRRLLLRPGVLLVIGLGVAATVVVPVVIETLPRVTARPEYRFTSDQVELSLAPPRWVPSELIEQVAAGKHWPTDLTSVLDDRLARRVALAFEVHPWVAEVVRVERLVPARLVVELRYRRPVAWVEVEDQRVLVDIDAVRLPSTKLAAAVDPLPLIREISTPPPSRPGLAWDDRSLRAAAHLAAALESDWEAFGLTAILVETRAAASHEDRVFLRIVTRGGSRVIWGRSPETRHPGELTVAQKLGRLKQFLSHFESLDPLDGPYEINIRHWREIIYRRLKSGSVRRLPVSRLR